ncbi:MAG: site-2 protease family protein, partial [Candidatus Magasanikbacteria bacterium]|nr:site-2 protease family protein [Candidatus Magasanikbacteria bacterium]
MILTLITFIAVLAVLVLVHELGHFIAARKNGIKVEEFGFGFPPRIFGVRRQNSNWQFIWGSKEDEEGGNTIYSLNWIPLGGFVRIKGEDGGHESDPDSFSNKKIWRRFVVLAAGVVMNVILAGVLLGVGYMIGIPQTLDNLGRGAKVNDAKIEIMSVATKAPAEA